MIQWRDVSFAYPDSEPTLREVSLTLEEAQLILVAGRTGSGKSTLLRTINGLVPRFTGGKLTGEVLVAGDSTAGVAPRDIAHLVGYVGQDPVAGFVSDIVEDELAYGMEQLGLDGQTMRRRVEETLDLLGIAELRRRPLTSLSGGQQQRVAMGSVLTMHPRVLVLDEPTSALDPTAAEDVLGVLARLVDDMGVTVVLAEHRMERVVPFADRLVLVEGGYVRAGEPAELIRDAPVAPPIVELGRLAGWDPLPLSVREARKLRRSLPLPDQAPALPRVELGDVLLRAERVVVTYGPTVAVREVSLDLRAGEVLAIMGRNGSGKSSLLWAMQGSGPRASGTVTAQDGVGLVPQTPSDLLYLESVRDECELADQGAAPGTCRALLDRIAPGIADLAHPRDLSEGQRLALALAIVLTPSPGVLMLDEPTRGLDYAGKAALAAILTELAAQGHAVAVATHDVEFAAHAASTGMVMAAGETISHGPIAKVLAESPAFAPQTSKILGRDWLTVEQVAAALPVVLPTGEHA